MLNVCDADQFVTIAGDITTRHAIAIVAADRARRVIIAQIKQPAAITNAVGRTSAAAPNAAPATADRSDPSAHRASASRNSSRPSERIAVSMYAAGPYNA